MPERLNSYLDRSLDSIDSHGVPWGRLGVCYLREMFNVDRPGPLEVGLSREMCGGTPSLYICIASLALNLVSCGCYI